MNWTELDTRPVLLNTPPGNVARGRPGHDYPTRVRISLRPTVGYRLYRSALWAYRLSLRRPLWLSTHDDTSDNQAQKCTHEMAP